jgi:tetratricopeptide (TPR) repeat protein
VTSETLWWYPQTQFVNSHMISRSGMLAFGKVLTGCLTMMGQQPDLPGSLEQLQETLKMLQAERKSLRETVKKMSRTARKAQCVEVPKPKDIEVQVAVTADIPDMEKASSAYQEGRRQEEQRLYRGAVESYSRAIQFDPQRDSAFLHRGYCYYHLAENISAVGDFVQSLKLQPNNSRAFLARARAYTALGQNVQAMLDASEAVRREPKNPDGYQFARLLVRTAGAEPGSYRRLYERPLAGAGFGKRPVGTSGQSAQDRKTRPGTGGLRESAKPEFERHRGVSVQGGILPPDEFAKSRRRRDLPRSAACRLFESTVKLSERHLEFNANGVAGASPDA